MTDVLDFPVRTDRTVPTVGPVERSRCLERLTDHLAAGRLHQVEFDARAQRALTAVTDQELDSLIEDLR